MLPNLESLTIRDIGDRQNNATNVVSFKNVKHYNFGMNILLVSQDIDIRDKIPKISFEQLESIGYFSFCKTPESINNLIEVLAQYKTLKSVILLSSLAGWSREQFTQLTESLPLITELSVAWSSSGTTDEFFAFLTEANRLDRITVRIHNLNMVAEFNARVPTAWTTEKVNVNDFYGTMELVRKK